MSQALPSVRIPLENPIRLYNFLTEKAFSEVFNKGVTPVKYEQIYSRFDTLAFQIKVENAPGWDITNTITCKAYDINEQLAYTFTTVNTLYGDPGLDGYFYYEVRNVLTVLSSGVYQLRIHIENWTQGIPPVKLNEYDFRSEPIYLQDQFEDSIIFKYGHESNNFGLLFRDPNIFNVTGVTLPATANQEYDKIGTYNGQDLYRSADHAYLLFYATTLQSGSVWVIQAEAGITPNEAATNYAYFENKTGVYTNVGTWAGTTDIDYAANYFYHRVYGGFDTNDYTPASNDMVYKDERFDTVLLESLPMDLTKVTIGKGEGVPNWQAGIINRILSCSYKTISGVAYEKSEGTKLEKTSEKEWPMMAWKVELTKASNELDNTYNGYDYNGDYYADYLINI